MSDRMELSRYSRQMLFPPWGRAGQERLRASRVALIGCGALGSSMANLLVRAGIGRLLVVDRDYLELHNLQRQSLFDEEDVARNMPKAEAARRKLARINSESDVDARVMDVHSGNVESIVEGCDLILDGTDNFETRYLVNDVSIKRRTPWIYGACVGAEGLVMPVLPGETPCLRCVFENPPAPGSGPTCDTAGILGPIVQTVAAIEVAEAMKILSGHREAVLREMVSIDLWQGRFRSFHVPAEGRHSDCPACGQGRFDFLNAERTSRTVTLCGRDAFQITPVEGTRIDLTDLRARWSVVGAVTGSEFLIHLQVDDCRLTVFADGRAIVHGAKNEAQAKSLYAKYVGI